MRIRQYTYKIKKTILGKFEEKQTYQGGKPCDNVNSTYTKQSPFPEATDSTSQDETVGNSCSQRTCRTCVFAVGSTSPSTNRRADSHTTSHRPQMSFGGAGGIFEPALTVNRDTGRMGCVVHDRMSCIAFTSVRSSDMRDWSENGPGGRGKEERSYRSFQSAVSQVISWNHFETCKTAVSMV